jgi:hypothetical protein
MSIQTSNEALIPKAKVVFPLLFACFLSGCATTDKIVLDSAPRPPTTNVDVFKDGTKPTRPFKEIAELSYLGPREDELKALTRFLGEAKKMGGDGVLFYVEYGGVKGGGTLFQSTAYVFKAKVIVYEIQQNNSSGGDSAQNRLAELSLIGHWESTTLPAISVTNGVAKLIMDFLPNNQVEASTICKNTQSYRQNGQYSVSGNTLTIVDPSSAPTQTPFSVVGDKLVIVYGTESINFIRAPKNTQ